VNVKFFLCLSKQHFLKAYGGSIGVAPRILNLGTSLEMSGQHHAPAALSLRKEHRVPVGMEAVARRDNPFPYRKSNPGRPAHSLVATLIEFPYD
jgi:hypothetical protein